MKRCRSVGTLLIGLFIIATITVGCDKKSIDNATETTETANISTQPQTSDYLHKYPDYIPERFDDEENRQPYSYSAGRDENGYWEGITALDYVEMFSYNGMKIPAEVHTVTDMHIDIEVLKLLENFPELELHALTDADVAESLGVEHGWTTMAEMHEQLSEYVFRNSISEWFMQHIEQNVSVSIPEHFMEQIEGIMIEFRRQEAADADMIFSEYVQEFLGVSGGLRQLVEESREGNLRNAKIQLVFQAIAEDMGLTVTDDDLQTYYDRNEITDHEGMVQKYGLPYLKQQTMNMVILDYIIENAEMQKNNTED